MDKILIRGLYVFAYHGVNPEEKENGQQFEIDATAYMDLSKAGKSDNLEDTVSYAKIIKTIKRVMTEQTDDLLERVSERIADAILKEYPPVEQVDITLKKPHAPINADFDYVGVEISRRR